MKDNSSMHKIDKKIQKTLKQILKNQNELFQLFVVAFCLFFLIYGCIWVYNTLEIFQILIGFCFVGLGLIIMSHKTQEEKKPQITLFFEKHIGNILYGSFILFIILSIYSFISTDAVSLVFGFYCVLAIFVFSKFLDHKLMDTIIKTKGRSIDFIQILIIFSSVVFVTLRYILVQFDITDERHFITAGVTLCFVALFTFLFSNLSEHSKNAVSKEKIHSHMLGNTYSYLLGTTIILCLGIISWQQFRGIDESTLKNESVLGQQFEEKPDEIIVEPIEEFIEEVPTVQTEIIEARVEELYAFNDQLQLGDSGEDVRKLQEFMAQKEYYFGELNGDFDEDTRLGLRNTLIGECEWPDSTRGILGPQATVCINNIVVSYEQEVSIEEESINLLEQDFE